MDVLLEKRLYMSVRSLMSFVRGIFSLAILHCYISLFALDFFALAYLPHNAALVRSVN